ncbi:NETI motif-containing protein [Bacillus sp. FJAT-49736]|uniref:NETI motif-containing protein n=1 Tax=Bacillus sp. FJAT-49736 TaxID=2833582 RepID=UPI001BC8FABD|nr:NETI motif-containing protein [Bacillus sp. FJAT-49736]MBS4175657.1 NETI motif-containing protein [Bacillus sp. FJAT-49736]
MSNTKKQFEVQENETIESCLKRMEREGYSPIKRIEKPIFKEVTHDGKVDYEPAGSKIQFEGRKND